MDFKKEAEKRISTEWAQFKEVARSIPNQGYGMTIFDAIPITEKAMKEAFTAGKLEGAKEHMKQGFQKHIFNEGFKDGLIAAANIALRHGETLGDGCWNHENREPGPTKCWRIISEAIRQSIQEKGDKA